jgi:NitT/TauT family transport system substrate-binding protein
MTGHSRKVARDRVALFATAGAIAAEVVACSGQKEPAGAVSGAHSGTDTTPIVYGQIQGSTNHTPLYVAIRRGFFKRAGLDVSVQTMSGGTPATMAAMNSGAINVMGAGAAEFAEYVGKKVVDGKMFGQVDDQTYDVVTAKDITGFRQLKGQPVGISGLNGGDNTYFDALLEKYGLSAKDVIFVTLGSATNRLTALANGAVKAVAIPNDRRAASSAVGNVILKSSDSPVHVPGGIYLATSDLLAHHRPLLQTFLRAMGEATTWIRNNKEAAAGDCVEAAQTTLAECRAAIDFNLDHTLTSPYQWSTTSAMNRQGIQEALNIVIELEPDLRGTTLDDVADFGIAGTDPSSMTP